MPQQNAPDHFDLLIGKSYADAAMLAAAEADQRIRNPVLLARRREAVRVVPAGIAKYFRNSMRDRWRNHGQIAGWHDVTSELKISEHLAHQQHQGRMQALSLFD